MKELIATVLFVVSMYSGTVALKAIHDTVKRAALEKASQGLPSLTGMVHAIRKQKGENNRHDLKK
jgi:hypothetical protein